MECKELRKKLKDTQDNYISLCDEQLEQKQKAWLSRRDHRREVQALKTKIYELQKNNHGTGFVNLKPSKLVCTQNVQASQFIQDELGDLLGMALYQIEAKV